MAKLDNPAGRLHELLRSYDDESGAQISVVNTWAKVFGVRGEGPALLSIAATASLVPDIEAALRRAGDEDQLRTFRRFSPVWLTNILRPNHDIVSVPSGSLPVDQSGLAVLGSVSAYLSVTMSEGVVPASDDVESLHQQVISVIDEIIDDETLPEDFKRLALEHAYRLAHALDDFRVGGPGAVKAATERLLGAMVMAPPAIRESAKKSGVMELFGKAWTIFTKKGPETVNALNAWATLLQLPGGSDS